MMNIRLAAIAASILTASCSGQMGQSFVPSSPGSVTGAQARQPNTVAGAPSGIAPRGWAATATQGIAPRDGRDSGALAAHAASVGGLASGVMTVRLGLHLRNEAELQRLIVQRQRISHAQFVGRFAPQPSDVARVTQYLQSQGFRGIDASRDRLLVTAQAPVSRVERAFNTKLETFSTRHGSVFANVRPALVPENLHGIVVGILGLTNAAKMNFTPSPCFPQNPATSGTPCLREYGPQEMQTFYDVGSTPTAAYTTVAVMAEGNVSQTVSDLRYAEQVNGLPQVPVSVVQVGLASTDTSGVIEWDLDSQTSTGIAGTVQELYLYATTSLTDSDIANEYDHWATDDKALLGNSSFGECEYAAYLDGSMAIDDQVLEEAAAQGQTMFASTGDTGSSCAIVGTNGVPGSGLPMVEYPASSPWVVGVGGTTLASNNDDTYLGETSWYGGGGGLSQFENSQKYMQKVQIVGGTAAEANLRGLPDIAMAGDPNAGGFNVYTATPLQTSTGACGEPCGVGGTSESSPLAMGSYARMQSAHSNALGFGGVAFYDAYIANPTASSTLTGPPPTQVIGGYHDAVTGANGAYSALPGYDYTNGMGSLDIAVMNRLIGH